MRIMVVKTPAQTPPGPTPASIPSSSSSSSSSSPSAPTPAVVEEFAPLDNPVVLRQLLRGEIAAFEQLRNVLDKVGNRVLDAQRRVDVDFLEALGWHLRRGREGSGRCRRLLGQVYRGWELGAGGWLSSGAKP